MIYISDIISQLPSVLVQIIGGHYPGNQDNGVPKSTQRQVLLVHGVYSWEEMLANEISIH